ncbi:MarR family winged helix-turn-helix transcriptional regulator [Variovorax sp. OV329]|uniref:MarR family winged helix-turn-helix transcriptional regulator n=1 Tax=Variovorax sp. OV329 TaxID=1882825 RepID=UPI0008F049B5|nr:MarR family winged helix-turn-helix transcriptional regulator [Variovorax sp. OV329]SFN30834.1 DNA-binding transcriptional regulator, MarR family [Variovorax sp. OV329]
MRKSVDHVNHKASAASPSADEDVLESVHALMHLFRSRQHRVLREGAHDVSHMEAKALGFFARRPGATLSDFVQHSGRDKGQMARLVGGLRERGLLEGVADETDRRSLRLSVSAVGKEIQAALALQGKRLSAQAVKGLGAEERAQLLALLARVRGNLEQE